MNNFDIKDYCKCYFNSIKDAVLLINSAYEVIFVNKASLEISENRYGSPVKTGKNILNYFEVAQHDIFIENFSKVLEGNEIILNLPTHGTKNIIFDSIVMSPLFEDENTIIGVILKIDVNASDNQFNEEIADNDYYLQLILQRVKISWWDWNLKTGKHYFDPNWWNMIGYEPNEIPVKSNFWNTIVHYEDIEKVNKTLKNAIDSGKTEYEIEYRLLHKNNHAVHILSKVNIIRNELNIPIRISGTNLDMTESKKDAEHYRQSENYLRNIFQNTEIGYIFLDTNLLVLSFNQTALQIAQSLNNISIEIGGNLLNFVTQERYEMLKNSLSEAVDGQKIEYQRNIINYKNEEEWFQMKLSPVYNTENEVVNVIMTLENITERKRSELQLNKSFELVSSQNKRLLSFSYIVSHNLRSHSSNIISIVDFLKDADSDEERNEMISHMVEVSKSLDDTLSNLNDIISIHTNINLIFEPLLIDAFIKKAVSILREQINKKEATVICNVPRDLVINYNPAYIESILLNFISNALKYSHPDRKPEITIDYMQDAGKPVLLISDNGIGIDLKKNGEKLFGLYKTFNSNTDARGIGLFITKNQVEYMGGKIEVESELGKGTTFKIHF